MKPQISGWKFQKYLSCHHLEKGFVWVKSLLLFFFSSRFDSQIHKLTHPKGDDVATKDYENSTKNYVELYLFVWWKA